MVQRHCPLLAKVKPYILGLLLFLFVEQKAQLNWALYRMNRDDYF